MEVGCGGGVRVRAKGYACIVILQVFYILRVSGFSWYIVYLLRSFSFIVISETIDLGEEILVIIHVIKKPIIRIEYTLINKESKE